MVPRAPLALALLLALSAGCLAAAPGDAGGTDGTTPDATEVRTEAADAKGGGSGALASVLAGLVEADGRAAYAEAEDLAYEDGRVTVVIELADDASVPAGHGVEVQHVAEDGRVVQATVPVDALRGLAEEPDVRVVRPPREAVARSDDY